MFRSKPTILMLTGVCLATIFTACDQDEAIGESRLADAAAVTESLDRAEFEAPQPTEEAPGSALSIASQSPSLAAHPLAGTVEKFYFSSTEDTVAATSASGGLIAPFPAGIATFDEPELNTGVLIAVKVYDEDHNLIGFGTEQEVLDMENASSETTFTFTLPGRGTLMLKQTEDFTLFFNEIQDMIEDEEYIRSFDPPLVGMTTVPHSGKIVGGTGEFEGAKGKMQEVDIVYGIDLVNHALDLTAVVRVKFK